MYLLTFQICWGIPVATTIVPAVTSCYRRPVARSWWIRLGRIDCGMPPWERALWGAYYMGGKLAHLGMMKDLPTVDILNLRSYLQWAAPQQRSRLWLPFFISLITTVNRISCTSSLLQLNANVYITVNHTTFTDLYYHTFQYWNHTIISNTSTNFLRMRILPSETILYSDF